MSTWLSATVRNKVKINGAEIQYYRYPLSFPANVGTGIVSRIYWKKEAGFEPSTGRLLISIFRKVKAFIDVGSNFGFYSVLASKVNPALNIFAFEPLAANVIANKRFQQANGVAYSVIDKGVGAEGGIRDFFIPVSDSSKGITTASFKNNFFFNKHGKTAVAQVEITTLDLFTAALRLPESVCLKIDVEGLESEVLGGATAFITKYRPVIVCEVDLASGNAPALLANIQHLGYLIFHLQPWGLVRLNDQDMATSFNKGRDFLFLPQEKLTAGKNFIPYDEFELLPIS